MVDDDGDLLTAIRLNLEMDGFKVVTAVARERHPSVMVLDVLLPLVDGWTVCDRLQRDPRTADIPIVITSILPQSESRDRGGLPVDCVDAYLEKPFDLEQLLSTVHRLTETESASM